jgi:hypothetical protein
LLSSMAGGWWCENWDVVSGSYSVGWTSWTYPTSAQSSPSFFRTADAGWCSQATTLSVQEYTAVMWNNNALPSLWQHSKQSSTNVKKQWEWCVM